MHSQVRLHECNRATNNLPGSVIIILIVEAVHTLGMIRESQRNVSSQCLVYKTINRILHCWDLVAAGARNKDRRNLARILLEISDRREGAERLCLFGLTVI